MIGVVPIDSTLEKARVDEVITGRVLLLVLYHDGALPPSTSTDSQSEFADLPFLVDGLQSTAGSPACGAALGSLPLAPIGEYRDRGQARESRACTARSGSDGVRRVEQLPEDAQDAHGQGEKGSAMWVLPNDQDVRVVSYFTERPGLATSTVGRAGLDGRDIRSVPEAWNGDVGMLPNERENKENTRRI
ncbi:hypothetical protein DFH06DRAFT_1312152 [Mycena polygramma]|nr:hypothetical protein DFH06DRAFT_1312152 [Mycena polygramma]